MDFPRAHPNAVRSIRHISLIKDWTRGCKAGALPKFSDFVPDERAGDLADLLIAEVHRTADDAWFYCRSSGARVDQMFDVELSERYFRDSIDPNLFATARPVWHGCLANRLPMCSVLDLNDRDGCPVTIEQIYMPYRGNDADVNMVVAAIHAWSVEGRFAMKGLMRRAATLQRRTVMIDPALASTVSEDIEIN